MPLKGTTYKRKYPTFQFLNEDIGFEWEIVEGENWEEIQDQLKAMADKQHRKNNPHLYQEELESTIRFSAPTKESYNGDTISRYILDEAGLTAPLEKISPKLSAHESMKNDILNAKDMVDLFTFRKVALSNDELKEAYQTRLKQLQ